MLDRRRHVVASIWGKSYFWQALWSRSQGIDDLELRSRQGRLGPVTSSPERIILR